MGEDLVPVKYSKPPVAYAAVGSKVVDPLFIVTPIVCGRFCFWSLFCYSVLLCLSSFAIFLMGKKELGLLCFNCLPDVV